MNNLKLMFKNIPVSEEYILNTLRQNNQVDKLIETLIIDEELKDIEVAKEKVDELLENSGKIISQAKKNIENSLMKTI